MGIKLPHALPSLDGARGAIVRPAYVLLAALTVAMVAGSLLFNGLDYFRNRPNAAAYGFLTHTDAQRRVAIDTVWPGAAARGLRRGDAIVALDGRAPGAGTTEFDLGAALGRAGGRLTLTVEREGRRQPVTLDRGASRWSPVLPELKLPLWAHSGFSYCTKLFFPLFLLAASLLLYLRRPRDPEAVLFAFAFLLICARADITWWMHPLLGIGTGTLSLINFYGWLACGIAVAGFPDGRFVTRWSRVSAMLILLAMLVVTPLLEFAPGAVADSLAVDSFYRGLMLLALLSVVLRWRGTADQTARQQIAWAVMGFVVAALAMLSLTPPAQAAIAVLGQPWSFLVSRLLVLAGYVALPLGLLVSLLRYRLYDADRAISRSAVFAVLTLGLLGVFAGTEKIVEALADQYLGGSIGALAGGIAAGVAAVVIVPMHGRVERWADRRFRGSLLRLRHDLPALVGDLRETADAGAIGEAVAVRVAEGVRAQRVAVLLDDAVAAVRGVAPEAVAEWCRGRQPEGIGDPDPSDPLLPVRVPLAADGCGRIGWLLLGPRPDGSLYNKDERDTLAAISDPVARALAIARHRKAREAEAESRWRAVTERLAALERALDLRPAG